jgi:hypothetical protein
VASVFLSAPLPNPRNPMESTAGQKGFRRSSRKRMISLAENFEFGWFVGYTLLTVRQGG